MTRGTPNRGRGRGGRGGAFSAPGTPRGGGRGGGARGGGGRGRGRGGATVAQNFSEVALDYSALSEAALGFNPSPVPTTPHAKPAFPHQSQGSYTPNLYSNYPPTPPNGGSNSSGYNTPKQGLGARGGRAGFQGARGGGRGSYGLGGAAVRGGMAGGLGFHAASPGRGRGRGGPVVGMGQGAFRPLLVPVTFVKASGLTPALDGDKEEEQTLAELPQDEEPTPGELEDKVMEGQLVDVVRDLDSVDIDAGDPDDSAMDVEDTTVTEDEGRVVDVPHGIVQDLKTNQDDDGDESSGDDEQIVFHPQAEPASAAPASVAQPPSSPPLFMIDTEPSPVQLASAPTSTSKSLPLGAPTPPSKPALASSTSLPAPVATSIPATGSSIPTVNPEPKLKQAKPTAIPPPKLTKSQKAALKKAGKKARKAGKAHARSGNRHLFVEAPAGYSDDEDDLEDDQAGREMFEKMGAVDLSDEEPAVQGQEEEGEARVGDSDLEWGSGGPGEESEDEATQGASRLSGKAKKLARRQQREERREAEKMERLTMQARSQVDQVMGGVTISKEVEIMYGIKKSGKKGGKKGRKQIELLAAEDYERNVLGLDPSAIADGEDDFVIDLQAAEAFSRGLIGGRSGRQATLTEMEDKARDELVASDGWRTSSGSEDEDSDENSEEDSEDESEGSDDSVDTGDEEEMIHSLAEADAVDLAIAEEEDAMFDVSQFHDTSFDSSEATSDEDAAIERALLAGGIIRLSSMGQSGSGGRRDIKEKKRVAKGKGKAVVIDDVYIDDDSEDSDEDEMFEGSNTWADNDEDYIRGVQEIIAANADLLERGGDRKTRKKLFKAVQEGNFEDFDLDFEDDYALTAAPQRKKKNKHEKPTFGGSFSAELEDQWSKDRSKKSEYKRQRALARAEAVEATSMSKKGPRAPAAFAGSSDASFLNDRIRDFLLYELSSPSMALPPMSKKSRVAVHLLAEVYGLKSKSLGKGKARFPVLERTSKSTVYGVDERKVRAILGTAAGEREGGWHGGKAKGKMGGLWAALSGEGKKSGGGGGGGKKNSEGAVVGQGADALGEGNIGFALLKKMGWTEGSQIGVSGGLSEPISARIKTSKSGLGSGYSVSRSEAQKLGKSDDQW